MYVCSNSPKINNVKYFTVEDGNDHLDILVYTVANFYHNFILKRCLNFLDVFVNNFVFTYLLLAHYTVL